MKYLPKVSLSGRGEYELQDAIQMLIDEYGPISGVEINHRYNLTSLDDFLNINLDFLKKMGSKSVIYSKVPKGTIKDSVYISGNVVIDNGCIVGPNAFVEEGVIINKGSILSNCVVLKDKVIKENSTVVNKVLM